ncbi:MAG: NAD-dependent epimerase/dehydratase family protein [Chthoniobacteraceae bacterium]
MNVNPPTPSHELPCETRQRTGRALVAGCGYLGLAAARLLHASGWEVVALTRRAESALALQEESFPVIACDLGERATLSRLGSFDAVLHTASSGHGGPEAYRQVFLDGTRNLLAAFPRARYVLTGSTSVYAQSDGSWVTEESPAEPTRETGKILLQAEALALEAGGSVARLSGIYGRERWVQLERFLSAEARIEGDGGRWINQIHRADAASALCALIAAEPGVYNVADGHPATQREIYSAFAAHFQRPLPPVAPPDLARKRGWSSKRVANTRLAALGWQPLYASFREALPAKKSAG